MIPGFPNGLDLWSKIGTRLERSRRLHVSDGGTVYAYQHRLESLLNLLLSHFEFVLPSLCIPLLSLQMMVAVGIRPVALGVMLVFGV
jgi:hypothetical protein